MLRIPKQESARLFKYVTAVDIQFNPWDSKSNSARELWRRLTSKKLVKSNPNAIVKAITPSNILAPSAAIKYVDGSERILDDTSGLTVDDILSEMNIAAARIDNEWVLEGKDLDDRE